MNPFFPKDKVLDDNITEKYIKIISNKNNLAKSIAVYIRNQIECIHVKFIHDNQMIELNQLIRNAIFTYLNDYGDNYHGIDSFTSINKASKYIYLNTYNLLKSNNLPTKAIKDFKSIVKNCIEISFTNLTKDGYIFIVFDAFIPDYWEDCRYNNQLKKQIFQ